jgi:xanthine/CO dehydrogenase XdhC/CoxF family maturation factor
MYSELESGGMLITDKQKTKVYGPVGLDIGAETSEEIALSVLAEIKAVLGRRAGLSLREKLEPIHSRSDQRVDYTRDEKEEFLCAIQTTTP